MKQKILIMGAGIRGKKLYHVLTRLGIEVTAFLDNDKNKQNKIIEGIMCYSVEKYQCESCNVMVFISPENSKELEKEIRKIYSFVLGENLINQILLSPIIAGYEKFFPIGYFFSLYPVVENVEKRQSKLQSMAKASLNNIDLRINEQLEILQKMSKYYGQILNWKDIDDNDVSELRYRYRNPSFSATDALGLYTMLRIIQPKKIIEVGSGWTSAIMLDTNEHFFNGNIELSFIEPYPDLLKSILKDNDDIHLTDLGLEDIGLDYFDKLESGDILFIDSTHISKSGSDVNYLFFEILPRLKSGVYIHLHDIFYPFEYPIDWIRKGMVFNELYLLRAFLQYNDSYEIVFFQNMIEQEFKELFWDKLPIKVAVGGGSFWMRKK